MTCATRKDSDQFARMRKLIKVFDGRFIDCKYKKGKSVVGLHGQLRWSDLCWSRVVKGTFSEETTPFNVAGKNTTAGALFFLFFDKCQTK